jgi:hypothetical protein
MPIHYTYAILKKFIPYNKSNRENLLDALRFIDPDNDDNYNRWCIDTDYLVENKKYGSTKCCCSHDITREFKAIHKITRDSLTIGCVCFNKFSPKIKKQISKMLKKKKNPDAKFCFVCDRKLIKGNIEGKDGNSYHKTCYKRTKNTRCANCHMVKVDCKCTKKKCLDCLSIIVNKPKWCIRCFGCYYKFKK